MVKNKDVDDDDDDLLDSGPDFESEEEADEPPSASNQKYKWTCTESEESCESSCHYSCEDSPKCKKACACGGGGCPECACTDEIDEVNDKAVTILHELSDLDDDVNHIGEKICTIETVVESNNDLLIEILKQVIENGANGSCDGPDVIVNCGAPCCDCPPIDPVDPGTGEPPVDLCLSETNVFEDGQSYTFSQYGISRKGVYLQFLGTSAINADDPEY
jgi:hypothetical protein